MAKAIVIGAGFGGMAAALRLRAKGYDVTIIDKQSQLGGRATQYQRQTPLGTFIHDAGPTVITAHHLIDELFELFGKKREDYVELVDLDPWYRIRFADGTAFNYSGSIERMEAEIARISPEDVANFRPFLDHTRRIFDVGFTKYGATPFHRFSMMLKALPDMLRLGSFRSVWSLASQYFRNEKLRRVFSFQPLLVGGNPFNTTSIYSLIFYLERQWGMKFVMGGTGALVQGLEKLMRAEGIHIELDRDVSGLIIIRAGHPAAEVLRQRADGTWTPIAKRVSSAIGATVQSIGDLAANVIVCNADAPNAWASLIQSIYHTRKFRFWFPRLRYSPGLFVLYFGTKRQYPTIAHHTIVLGNAYEDLLTKIFDKLELEDKDLSVYLHRPTATDPGMAPSGCDSFYCLVPVPNLKAKIDWSEWGPKMREATIDYLERTTLPGLREAIVDDFYVTPEHFEKNLNSLHGAGFSIQPLMSQSGYFRFHNKAPGIEGLYFVGQGTHPGAGLPGVLCSAKVVDSMIPTVS